MIVMATMVVMALRSPSRGIDARTRPTWFVVKVGVIEGSGIIVMAVDDPVGWGAATTGTSTDSMVFVMGVLDFGGR